MAVLNVCMLLATFLIFFLAAAVDNNEGSVFAKGKYRTKGQASSSRVRSEDHNCQPGDSNDNPLCLSKWYNADYGTSDLQTPCEHYARQLPSTSAPNHLQAGYNDVQTAPYNSRRTSDHGVLPASESGRDNSPYRQRAGERPGMPISYIPSEGGSYYHARSGPRSQYLYFDVDYATYHGMIPSQPIHISAAPSSSRQTVQKQAYSKKKTDCKQRRRD
ncbi:Secreted protein [Plasmodiophora brassicae]